MRLSRAGRVEAMPAVFRYSSYLGAGQQKPTRGYGGLRRAFGLTELFEGVGSEFQVPGAGGCEGFVDVADIFDADGFEPVLEGGGAFLCVDGDAVFPGGATAEDTVELSAGFAAELEGLDEDRVGDAGGEIDEGLVGHGFGVAEVLQGLGSGVGFFALEGAGAFDVSHLDGDFDLEHVDAVASFAELGHGAGDDLGLLDGVGEGLLVTAVGVVADHLEEEGDVVIHALVAYALDPGMLEFVDLGLLERRVVEQDLDTVGPGFFQTAHAPDVEQVGETTGGSGVVAGLLVGEEQAGAVAMPGGVEAELGVEQDGRGVAGENLGDEGLELAEVVGVDNTAALLGEGLLERPALIHGGGGDNAASVRYGFQACELTWGDLHGGNGLLMALGLHLRRPFYTAKVRLRVDGRLSRMRLRKISGFATNKLGEDELRGCRGAVGVEGASEFLGDGGSGRGLDGRTLHQVD